eukprot:gene6704-7797_t
MDVVIHRILGESGPFLRDHREDLKLPYQDFFGTNQFNGQFGGVSFSAGFGLFPGLFGLHFYEYNCA